MTNLLKLFNESSREKDPLSWEERIEGNQITQDLKNIISTFKKIKAEFELQGSQDAALIGRINEGLANAENLLLSMQRSLGVDESLQVVVNVNRP